MSKEKEEYYLEYGVVVLQNDDGGEVEIVRADPKRERSENK